ncbi:hypothetical protein, partial [Anaerococcus tetradius]|uniref:hypothetical protein n=1 Tax=Anaerococcus tetradius TaxID=33036 RepID=UPI0006990775
MSKYKKAKILLETKALYKKVKPIYATRKLSIGLVSCMLGLTLIAPNAFAQEELVENTQVQETDQEQGNEDAKDDEDKNKEIKETTDLEKVKVASVEEQQAEDILTEDEIQEIRTRANSLENSYFFNGKMVEDLKAELRKAKADPSVNYEETKARLIEEAIQKNIPDQKAPGEVRAVDVKEPSVNPVFYNDTTISGGKLAKYKDKVNRKTIIATVHVTLKGKDGTEKANLSVTPTSGTTWSVNLPEGKKVEEGDTVTVYQQIGEVKSTEVNATAKPSKASTVTLTMPTGEIWIEQTSSNIVNKDEQAEAIEMLKKANPDIVNDIDFNPKKTKFSIDGTDHAYYEVTYTDGSKSGKVEATNLKIKKVTEYSQSPTIAKTYVADGKITITFKNEIAAGSKIGIIQTIDNAEKDNFCTDEGTCPTGKCNIDKSTVKWVSVDASTKTFIYNIGDNFLKYGKDFGVVVKEYGKFSSCKKTEPVIKIPNVPVRDPKKLTETEKEKIREEIRKANTTTSNKSKLPDWEVNNIPAYIDFDKDGNVKIIDPSVVDGDWEDDYTKFVPNKNSDGTIKVSTSDKDKVIPVEKNKLVTNLAPNKPTISYKKETGEITVTPDKADTDAKIITVKYKDPEGKDHEVTITKANGENGKWSAPKDSKVKVNPDTGVVTINDFDIQNKTNVSAKVTDNGGIADNDKDAKTSDNKSVPIKIYPKKPKITINDQDGSVTITPVGRDKDRVAKEMVIGYSPVGNREVNIVTVDIDENGNLTLPEGSDFKLNKDGKSITITNDKIKSNTDIVAQTEDGDATDKLESEQETKQVPDKTAPQPPTVNVEETYGRAYITPPTDPDTKTIKVEYLDPKGIKHTFTVTKNGNSWGIEGESGFNYVNVGKISIGHDSLKRATEIKATATDEAGNESKPGTDISLPPAPDVKLDEDNGVITVTPPTTIAPLVDGMEITYTPATEGASETKLVAKKDNAGKWSIENIPEDVAIDKNTGVVTITNDKAEEKSKVIAYSLIDTKKKSYEKGEAKVPDTTPPEAPEVKVQDDGSVTITPKKDSDTKTVTVTYKNQDGEDKTATATKGDKGEWTVEGDNGETIDKKSGVITIPKGKSNPGDKVVAKAKDPSENESGPSDDTTMPAPPTITPDQTSGNVTITPPAKGNLDGMDIEYKTPEGTDRKVRVVKGTDKKWKIEGENPDRLTVVEGTGVVTIPKGKAKEKTEVIAKSTLGEKKAPAQKTPDNQHLVPDKTAPNPPEVKVDENTGNVTITPPKDEDTISVTVTYKKADNTEIKVKAKKVGKKWSLTKEDGKSPVDNGESVDENSGVIALAKGKYKTGEIVKAYGNDNANNQSSEDNKTPVEVTFDANGGSKKMDGSILALSKGNVPQGQSAVLSAVFELPECKFAPPEGKKFAGWQVGSETKKAGEKIQIKANTTVTAIWKDIEYKVSFNGNT